MPGQKKQNNRRSNKNDKHSAGQLLNFTPDSYLERTSRPIYAIVFLLPFIVFYEIGTILIRPDVLRDSLSGRVAAFSLVQRLLEWIGFGSKFAWIATPLAVIVILASLQLASRKRWVFWFGDVAPMTIECIFLAVPLIVLSLFLNSPSAPVDDASQFNTPAKYQLPGPHCDTIVSSSSITADNNTNSPDERGTANRYLLADIVTSIGAGIYEELVFRLILICILMTVFQDVLRFDRRSSIMLSVLISAGLFSAYHHVDFLSGTLNPTDPFNLTKFVFRALAGVYFAVLFAIRGFGIAAGTHAFYDIIATVLNSAFFEP